MKEFKCNYCGKEYDNPEDMARCIITCAEEIKIKEEQNRIENLEKEKEKRKKEVNDAYENFIELSNKYNDDYNKKGSFRLRYEMPQDINYFLNLLGW